jgi:hypothetical protein
MIARKNRKIASTDKYGVEHLPGFDQVPQDMKDALGKFDSEAEQIVYGLLSSMESQEPPPIIYHYTDDRGLTGILESGQLWLTDAFSLNDPSELRHGFSRAIKLLSARAENGSVAHKLFCKNFAAFAQQEGIQRAAHYFVCCFSAAGDDLGQWRAYADNGRGYALAFDTKSLESGFTKKKGKPIPNNSTFRVIYNDAQVEDIHRQIIDRVFDLVLLPTGRGLSNEAINVYMSELQMVLTFHILRSALFFKHEAYTHEQEFRFMQMHRADAPPLVKTRLRPYILVKYREFDWKRSAPEVLTKIVIGPAADRTKALRFAKDCLGLFYPKKVELTQSEIPYRAV